MSTTRRGQGTPKPHGHLRLSQVVTTFGPGALMDLPRHGVIIGGLELWGDPVKHDFRRVSEPRLARKVAEIFGRAVELYAPPEEVGDGQHAMRGIRAVQFPEWFVTTKWEEPEAAKRGVRARPIVRWRTLQKGRYQPETDERGAKLQEVTPIRFVQACPLGHISDVDWNGFVHSGRDCREPRLWLDEEGTVGDLSDIWVRCAGCGLRRQLITATMNVEQLRPLGVCHGNRPWLGPGRETRQECVNPDAVPARPYANRLLVRSASNAWFPTIVSVITIPEADAALRQAVEEQWGMLQVAKERSFFNMLWLAPPIQAALGHFGADAVWAEVERRHSGAVEGTKKIKQAELETLLAAREEVGDDRPGGEFFARRMTLPKGRSGPMEAVERVVLLHRLREVLSLVGFSRFEPVQTDIDGELELGVKRAALALDPRWMPTIENRGEGLFVSFDPSRLDAWSKRPEVRARENQLRHGYLFWCEEHQEAELNFPGMPYLLLHSLSHLLITAVALECGYSTTSIRERIYVGEVGCGILLYTGTFDAEGTLGGLVEAARRLPVHLRNALDLARLCSNDPVCAQHRPDHAHERRHLHGAACHGCLLIGETCCERRNEFLDRALVVETVESHGAAFFKGM